MAILRNISLIIKISKSNFVLKPENTLVYINVGKRTI
jgi:hypothetical protein